MIIIIIVIRAEETAQSVQCLLYRHEGLNLVPRTHILKQNTEKGRVGYTSNPRKPRIPVRDPFSKSKVSDS